MGRTSAVMQVVLIAFLVLELLPPALSKLTAADLIANKRRGKLTWGEFYDIPDVAGARAWAFTESSPKGRPISSGVKLTRQFLSNAAKIPCRNLTEKGLEKSCYSDTWMNYPSGSAFKFMGLSYTSGGHAPVGIYDKPHFDMHFYRVPQSDILKYLDPATNGGPCPPAFNPKIFSRAHKPIPTACYPTKGYVNDGSVVPLMGNHLMPVTSHEFTHPGSFNATFIYGSFDGKITYYEPMVTLKTLLKKRSYCGDIPAMPKESPEAGWYPTTWCFYSYRNGDAFVELRDYIWRKAGCKKPKTFDGYFMPADPKAIPAICKYAMPPKRK